ncbi:MAG TPA: patatin-like phospholipase family protein [Hyphomonadaceae bacterium]|nr:patatin-like phospholipase family protein [Hyphomonadaceae bacterium]
MESKHQHPVENPGSGKPCRVLALDGGGAKGFYTLGALKEIEGLVGCRLCERFDLIYGTSTGAIIAALLGLGKSVDDIEELYRTHVVAVMSHWLPRNKTGALEALAAQVFGELKFDAFKTDMGIVGTRWSEERPIIFKTNRRQAFLGKSTFEPGFGCTIGDAVVGSCSAYPFFKKKFVTTSRGERIEVRDGGFVANNPTLYAIVDAAESMGFARKEVRVVSIGVGEYPAPKLPAWSLRKWLSKLPTMVFLQKTMEISTQSMDQLRKVLFREVPTIRIHNKYTQPELATDMLEVDLEKLGLLWQRGRDSARDLEADLKKFLL